MPYCHQCQKEQGTGEFCEECGAELQPRPPAGPVIEQVRGDTGVDRSVSQTVVVSPAGANGREALPYDYCPIDGVYLPRDQTFRCRRCGREHICKEHLDPDLRVCSECAAEMQHGSRREGQALAGIESSPTEPAAAPVQKATPEPAPSPTRRRLGLAPLLGGAAGLAALAAIVVGLLLGLPGGDGSGAPQAGATQERQSDGMVMVSVPAGEFLMGSPQDVGDAKEHPQHAVTLDAFWIDKYEVSNDQYRRCVVDGACTAPVDCDWSEPTYEDPSKGDHPVACVSWFDAEAYCAWAGARLPTEAEWEKAARGTDSRTYPWGNAFDASRLNYCDRNCEFDYRDNEVDDGYARTAPVGSYLEGASPYRALDMAGNVWEWVADWYGDDTYSSDLAHNPTGPTSGGHRVLRGGSWDNAQDDTRAALRHTSDPEWRSPTYGFRCATSSP